MCILDELKQGLRSTSPEETADLAVQLARALPADAILTVQGDLGVGKTTLVKGLAKAWGIHVPVKSPTYNLVSIYEGSRQLVHVDAYRLEGPQALEGLMLEEFLRSPYALVIEWPERVAAWLPPETYWLEMTMDSGHVRHLRLRDSEVA